MSNLKGTARLDQAHSSNFLLFRILQAVVRLIHREMKPPPIRIQSGGVYTSDEVMSGMGIGKPTLQKWLDNGLPCSQPFSKSQYFLGDDVIRFLVQFQKIRDSAA